MQVSIDNYFLQANIPAIVKFQSLWRGYRIRKNYISRELYVLSKRYIDQCQDMTALPRASSGITKVYFPPELPVVFKALGKVKSKYRFFTMWNARDLCVRNGYKRLLIPAAQPYDEYNIEERLPIHDVKQREQVALYVENLEGFSLAVKEFTGFLCQCVFPDILTYTHPYQKENKIPLGRCDNLPLIFDRGMGEIALIDLGGHKIRNEKLSLSEAIESAKTAIYIFPYHFEDIVNTVSMFCPEIIKIRDSLQEICEQTLTNFKSIYEDHRDFVQKILSKSFLEHASSCQKENVQQKVQLIIFEALKKYHFLADHLDGQSLDVEIQEILAKKIMLPIVERLTENIAKDQPLSSLVHSRSITINLSNIFQCERVVNNIKPFLKIILDELLHSKEICYANQYYSRSQELLIRIHY